VYVASIGNGCEYQRERASVYIQEKGARNTAAGDKIHLELFARYQASLDEEIKARFKVNTAMHRILDLEDALEAASLERDLEKEHSELLTELATRSEEDRVRLAVQADTQRTALADLQEALCEAEDYQETNSCNVQDMAAHVKVMQRKLEELQGSAAELQEGNERGEADRQQMLTDRINLLQRQMELIGELASSEFAVIEVSEELEEAQVHIGMLQDENDSLAQEYHILTDLVLYILPLHLTACACPPMLTSQRFLHCT
jgi:chromosome segregation ATPase